MTFRLLVIRICSHLSGLSGLKTICHSLSHSCRWLRSVCSDAAFCWSRMTLYRWQSSAKSRTEEETLEGRSLMYTKNRRGPSTVPCGTPDVTAARDDVFHQGPLADFYSRESFVSRIGFCLWCHSNGAWLQGADGEPYQKPCWKAAKIASTCCHLSSPTARSCTVVMSWVSQDLFFLKPCW